MLKIRNSCLSKLTSSVTKGAMSPPSLAYIEPVPIPVVRSTVGNSSAENMYIMLNDPAMQNRPIIERMVRVTSIPGQKIQHVDTLRSITLLYTLNIVLLVFL